MTFFNTQHKRKSAIITAVLGVLIILIIINYGMQYLDPPEEYGVAINFGNSNVGSGKPVEKVKTQPTTKTVPKEVQKATQTPKENVITDDTSKETTVVQ